MSVDPPRPSAILDTRQLAALQGVADAIFVHDAIARYAVRLVAATRNPEAHGIPDLARLIAYGASPRATLGLVAAARALALLRGREYTLPADVRDVASEVITHRLVPSFDALADGIAAAEIVDRVIRAVPLPRVAPGDEGTTGEAA
jgi:MoxR-like ATPase